MMMMMMMILAIYMVMALCVVFLSPLQFNHGPLTRMALLSEWDRFNIKCKEHDECAKTKKQYSISNLLSKQTAMIFYIVYIPPNNLFIFIILLLLYN